MAESNTTQNQEPNEASIEAEEKKDVSVNDVSDSVSTMKLNETAEDTVPQQAPAQESESEEHAKEIEETLGSVEAISPETLNGQHADNEVTSSTTTQECEEADTSNQQQCVDILQDATLKVNSDSLVNVEQSNIDEIEDEGSGVDPVTAPQKRTADNEDNPEATSEEMNSEKATLNSEKAEGVESKLTSEEPDQAEEIEAEQSQSEDENDDRGSDVEDAAPVRRRRGVSSDVEEEVLEEEVVESEGNLSEEDERDVIVEEEEEEEEEGECSEEEETIEEEKEPNEEKEDTENPQFVPKHGMFFMHDNRTDASSEEKKELPSKKKLWNDKGKWGHDHFNLDEQGPKSYREVVSVYGYDVRDRSSPPTSSSYTRGRGVRGRGRGGQRSRPLVSDYIENSARKDDQAEASRGSTQRKGFGRGLQRGRRRTYPKQSEERMVDDIYGESTETTETHRTSGQENHTKDAYSENRHSNQEVHNRRNRSSNWDSPTQERIRDNDDLQSKTNRGRNSNWQRRGGEEQYETTTRQENRDDKRDTRYRNERPRNTYETEQNDYRFRNKNQDHRNLQNRFSERETFDGNSNDSFEKRNEASRGNQEFRYSRRGGFSEGRPKGPSNESTFHDSKRPKENKGGSEENDLSRVSAKSVVEEEWPTLGKQPSHAINNPDNLLPSSPPNEWTAKTKRKDDHKELSAFHTKTDTQQNDESQIQNTITTNKDRVSKSIDNNNSVEEAASSRESKSFSQRRHQRSTLKEIPKIPVIVSKDVVHPEVVKDGVSGNPPQATNPAPKLLQNFQIRLERGQRMIIDDEKSEGDGHVNSKDEPADTAQVSIPPAGRGGSRPHRYSSQRQRVVEGRVGIQASNSESPPHYFEPGYQGQVYQSDGTPPPNMPDTSRTPPHGMMRQTTNPSGSPSPRLPNQRPPPPMTDPRPSQPRLSDAAALLPNRIPVQGIQHTASAHPRNTGMLHPAVSMGAHPPQGAFPPTTFVHYNPGHPVPQPVHPRPAQGHPVQPPVHPRPPHGHPGPPHGHPRPAQGLPGPITAPYQIGGPLPVQHYPVTSVPQAAVGATQNLPSIGQQIQPEVMIDNHGLTYNGATYYSPEIQLGMQRAPPRRQPQPVRIEAPPGSQYVEYYQEN